MPEYGQVPTNSFVGGLITEAGELTFPDKASVDELNCDLLKTGARRRRLGISIEAGSSPTTETLGGNTVVTTHVWKNVGEQANVTFTVLQIGATLMFFDQGDGSGSLSGNRVDTTKTSGVEYTLDMSSYDRPNGNGAGAAEIQVTSVKGALVVSSPEINTFYITRNVTTGAFTDTEISFRVRDFAWQGDISEYDEEVSTGSVTIPRMYDTKNAGWADGPNDIGDAALTSFGAYPPLTHPWYSGKNSSGAFSKSEWEKIYTGSSLISNGHYILDLYTKDRGGAIGLTPGLGATINTTEDSRFSTVATYAGRVFYAGMPDSTDDNGNKIYFSQVLENDLTEIGEVLQKNDPTSEELSDLLDTDGGFIVIPEAHNILKLHPFGAHLWVFAANGVWRIGGIDDVFRASDYTVNKVTEDGIDNVGSFVSAQGQPFWWSNNGIFGLAANEQGVITPQNLSIGSIQSFWENITADKRDKVRSVYDAAQRRVIWLYPETTETNDIKRNRLLIFDETLGAFFPWSVSDESANTNYIVDATFIRGVGEASTTFNVVDSSGTLVQDSTPQQVTVTRQGRTLASSKAKYLVVDGDTGKFTFAEFTGTDFLDWGSADFSSYAEAGYNFMGDLETRKNAPFVTVFLKDTAEGFSDEGSSVYEVIRDSSCLVSAYYDFGTVPTTALQEAFRRPYTVSVDTSDLTAFNYPETVISTRLKMRGRGRSMRLRFESSTGKDFHLLGYNVIIARSGRF